MTYSKGRAVEVEVSPATWRRAIVMSATRCTYTVQWSNNGEKEEVLREKVRPPPPFRENVNFWSPGDLAEALVDGVWKAAQVTDVGFRTGSSNEHFIILDGEYDELTVKKWHLRHRRVFKDGHWTMIKKQFENERNDSSSHTSTRSPQASKSEQNTENNDTSSCSSSELKGTSFLLQKYRKMETQFSQGRQVEVLKDDKWHKAVVLFDNGQNLIVEYNNADIEYVPINKIRLPPPFKDNAIQWSPGDIAEALVDGMWVPVKVKGGTFPNNYIVEGSDQHEFVGKWLRKKRIWHNERWITTLTRKDWEDKKMRKRRADSYDSDESIDSCDSLFICPLFDRSEDEGIKRRRLR